LKSQNTLQYIAQFGTSPARIGNKVSRQFRALKLCLVLFTLAGVQNLVQAEVLYQWKEADGSLTFAPSPPPEGSGIAYKVVEPSASVNPVALVDELPTANELAKASSLSRNQPATPATQTSSPQPQSSIEYTPMDDKIWTNESSHSRIVWFTVLQVRKWIWLF